MKYAPVVEAWRDQSAVHSVDGVATRVWNQGQGEAVVCIHGVPTSAYCYRKLLPELASLGMRGIAFDLPGLGLADRPDQFDYSWSGLGVFATKLIESMNLGRFHLLVHDIGGPVGFGILERLRDQISSLTVLNTMTLPTKFKPHPMMRIFTVPLAGELSLAALNEQSFAFTLNSHGFMNKLSRDEYRAYYQLLKGDDHGRSFLRIMRAFEMTEVFEDRIIRAAKAYTGPRQIIWGADDHALPLSVYGEHARQVFTCNQITTLPAKHFVQEDCYREIAAKVAAQVASAQRRAS
ncbi:MAG: alpha/beta fold hydrolase [Deltaproteobacteria bacterium]|nr:alpha/beta fold hydrolase [Deltaproteobacteria bacterium]